MHLIWKPLPGTNILLVASFIIGIIFLSYRGFTDDFENEAPGVG